jgi:hypothetical protein
MSGLLGLLQAITPVAPPPPTEHYDGLEYRWKMLTFRPAEFKFEAYALSFLAVFFAVWYTGKTINAARAKKLLVARHLLDGCRADTGSGNRIAPYMASIESQFSFVRPLVSSGPALHLLYASGRRNAVALHTTLTLLPRHDIISLIRHFARMIYEPTYDAGEKIQFAFTLGRGDQGLQGEGVGVWAVVEKGFMRQFRAERWDMVNKSFGVIQRLICRLSPVWLRHRLCPRSTACTRSTLNRPICSSRLPRLASTPCSLCPVLPRSSSHSSSVPPSTLRVTLIPYRSPISQPPALPRARLLPAKSRVSSSFRSTPPQTPRRRTQLWLCFRLATTLLICSPRSLSLPRSVIRRLR